MTRRWGSLVYAEGTNPSLPWVNSVSAGVSFAVSNVSDVSKISLVSRLLSVAGVVGVVGVADMLDGSDAVRESPNPEGDRKGPWSAIGIPL